MDEQIQAKIMNRIEKLMGVVIEQAILKITISRVTGKEKEFNEKLLDDKLKEQNSLYTKIQNELYDYK